MKYELAGETFTSLDAIKKRCREILYADGPIEGQDHAFLFALLGRHRQAAHKIGVGVRRFSVRVNEWATKGFWAERVDGTETDWSFIACLRAPTHKAEVTAALRVLIAPQIREFRAHAYAGGLTNLPCAITGIDVPFAESHVDHQPPDHFASLVQRFFEFVGIKIADVAVVPTIDGVTYNSLVDEELARRWIDFHARNARLRITTKEANFAQGTGT